jgi:U3 small nucleolar ribonucleoprotein protein IMP4
MSLRRHVRLRREYLYRKSLEGKESAIYERKAKIRNALRTGKAIPTEVRGEADALRNEISLEDEHTKVQKTHIDDEYAYAGVKDPKVCVTTSHDPSSRLKMFAKEVRLMFPNAQRINRGSTKTDELVEACREHGFTDIVMLQENRGEPTGMVVCHLPYGPTAYFALSSTVMRHDIENKGTVSEAFPHLIFNGFETETGQRIQNILKHLFPVPKPESKRVMTFHNDSDFISFRHHTFEKPTRNQVELQEVGPRFEMRPYLIRLGVLGQNEAEVEWALRPYMVSRSARLNHAVVFAHLMRSFISASIMRCMSCTKLLFYDRQSARLLGMTTETKIFRAIPCG